MKITRQQLHLLVDSVEEKGLETLFNVMIRFIPEDLPLPDELESHAIAAEQYRRGDYVRHEDIDWA